MSVPDPAWFHLPVRPDAVPFVSLLHNDQVVAQGLQIKTRPLEFKSAHQAIFRAFYAADDCGTIYNHKLVEGQLHGGLMQGLGQVIGEHIAYDHDSGQLLSGSFMDYFMPRADHLPPITLIDCAVPSPAISTRRKLCGSL